MQFCFYLASRVREGERLTMFHFIVQTQFKSQWKHGDTSDFWVS